MDGTVARQGMTDASGDLRFDNLPFGPYIVVEEDRAGWNELTARTREIDVVGNLCNDPLAVIEFENEQDDSGFCIEGRKIDALDGWGIAGWTIEIEALDEGGALPIQTTVVVSGGVTTTVTSDISEVTTDGIGEFRFDFEGNDYRVPGGLYEVCEQEQDGWLAHTPTCQTVRLPEWPRACVKLEDFVNQQVGHSESEKHDKHDDDKGGDYDKSGKPEDDHKDGGHQEGGQPQGGPQDGGNQEGGQPQGGPQDGGNQQGGYPEGGSQQGGNQQGGSNQGNSSQGCSSYHEVKAGEGLYDIGRQYGKTPQQMLDANPSVRKAKKCGSM
jgi:hypothetical protein